ncbi:MAG: hypothetical protein HY543_00280 [Deltaproteobacteria bacterium]|nr:hypothetical protein [Deltaproteobacteria bacterium]
MRSGEIPFRFDVTDVTNRLRRLASKHLGNITLSLPGVSIPVILKDREKQVAREIVIRLKDRRVLSSWECCDNCIDQALVSLQEIRKFLVNKQVELSDVHDGPLYIFVDAMVVGIRQFLTFEQHLTGQALPKSQRSSDFHRPLEARQEYFDALEILRGHLSRCLEQIRLIAGMNAPKDGLIKNYEGGWQIEAYEPAKLIPKPGTRSVKRKSVKVRKSK